MGLEAGGSWKSSSLEMVFSLFLIGCCNEDVKLQATAPGVTASLREKPAQEGPTGKWSRLPEQKLILDPSEPHAPALPSPPFPLLQA